MTQQFEDLELPCEGETCDTDIPERIYHHEIISTVVIETLKRDQKLE